MWTRTLKRLTLSMAAAAAVGLIAAGTAQATAIVTLSTGDSLALPTGGGTVTFDVVLQAGPEGVSGLGWGVVGAPSGVGYDSTAYTITGFGGLTEFTACNIAGADATGCVGFTAGTGPASTTGTVGTVTFSFTANGTAVPRVTTFSLVLDPESFDNSANYLSFGTSNTLQVTVAPIPEPGTILLIGAGLAGLAVAGRRQT